MALHNQSTSRTRLQRSLQLLQKPPVIAPCTNLLSLPHNVLSNIARYLDPSSLLCFRLTCKKLFTVRIAKNSTLTSGNLLPMEIIQIILSYLVNDPVSFDAARQTCRSWRGASYGRHLLQSAVENLGIPTDINSLLPLLSPTTVNKQISRLSGTSSALRFCSRMMAYASSSATTTGAETPPDDVEKGISEGEKQENHACQLSKCDSSRCEAARLSRMSSVLATNSSRRLETWRSLKLPRVAYELGRTTTVISPDGLFILGLDEDAKSGRVYALYEPRSYFGQLSPDEGKNGGLLRPWFAKTFTYRFPGQKSTLKVPLPKTEPRTVMQNTDPCFLFALPKLDSLGNIRDVKYIVTPERMFRTYIYLVALVERRGNYAVVVWAFKYAKLTNSWSQESTAFHELPKTTFAYDLFSVSPAIDVLEEQLFRKGNRLSVFIAVGNERGVQILRLPIVKEKVSEVVVCDFQTGFAKGYTDLRWDPVTLNAGNSSILLVASRAVGSNDIFALSVSTDEHLRFTRVLHDEGTLAGGSSINDVWVLKDSKAAIESKRPRDEEEDKSAAATSNSNASNTISKLAIVSDNTLNSNSYYVASLIPPADADFQRQSYSCRKLCMLKTPSSPWKKATAFDGVAIEEMGTYIAGIFQPDDNVRLWVTPYCFQDGRKSTFNKLLDDGELPYQNEEGKSLGSFTGATNIRFDWRPYESLYDNCPGRINRNTNGMVLRLIIGCDNGNVFACDLSDIGPGGAPIVTFGLEQISSCNTQGQPKRWVVEKSSLKCIKA